MMGTKESTVKGYPHRVLRFAVGDEFIEIDLWEGPGPPFVKIHTPKGEVQIPKEALESVACWLMEPLLGSITVDALMQKLELDSTKLVVGRNTLE